MTGAPPDGAAEAFALADPERALAVTYAPIALRPGLTALFALDERMGAIVAATREPMIGLMRLAWWRERIEGLATAPPPAEPLLGALADTVIARGVDPAPVAGMEDGWAALLDGEPDAETIARHGRERGGNLFAAAAALLDVRDDRLVRGGTGWALADLGHRHSDEGVRAEARRQASPLLADISGVWPRPARPLAALILLAARDAADGGVRRQGAPGRLARMLALRLTGR